jgi:hypothetical protein
MQRDGLDPQIVGKARAERLLAEYETMLSIAKSEMAEGTYGASDWVAHNEKKVEGLEKVLAVHADQSIDDGTAVQTGWAPIDRKPFATDQPGRNTTLNNPLKNMTKNVAVTDPLMTGTRERRMIRDIVLNA